MAAGEQNQKYGISVRLPDDDPLSAPHLLGVDWVSTRWYASAGERDAALKSMQQQPSYYRSGDTPSALLAKIDP